ncbi:MAG: pyridoxine 5'-phosphate synthase [Muribaculaceae bacterium]|nr:pyridoxine 5'-phosphate synthase [Muribaculaceae bacterium]
MTNLSVNINKIATLRNARGGNRPDVEAVALDIESFGADGITVHPRPDERHIRRSDVLRLRPLLRCEFNIEGNPTEEFIKLVMSVRPTQVTLVPDAPDALTSSAGWNVAANADFLAGVVESLKEAGIRTSIFVDADADTIRAAAATGTDRVELYTKPYADGYAADRRSAVEPFVEAANAARRLGLGVNAGHDLSLENLRFFSENIPFLSEVSIGHALICDALYMGLENAVRAYKECLIH